MPDEAAAVPSAEDAVLKIFALLELRISKAILWQAVSKLKPLKRGVLTSLRSLPTSAVSSVVEYVSEARPRQNT